MVLDVPEVELDPLGPGELRATVDLRPAGDPRLDVEPVPLALVVLIHLVPHVGRGPISDISPRTTFQSCGSSSSEIRRSSAPTRVMRGSPRSTAYPAPTVSAPTTIVRSLRSSKSTPFLPTRVCRRAPGAGLQLDRDRGDCEQRAREHEASACDGDVGGAVQRVPSGAPTSTGPPRRT